jgi:hypothetical protein
MLTEALAVTLQVTEALEQLGVPYVIGGSLASAVHGVMRSTLDADVVADLHPEQAGPLVQVLGQAFYADLDAINEAIKRRSSFNLLHLATMFKVDIFVAQARSFDQAQLARRQAQLINLEPEQYAYMASPEDIVLAKLEWYRLGGEVSDRQWQDVLGVLKVQANRLDYNYLNNMAVNLGLPDLLQRALAAASNP